MPRSNSSLWASLSSYQRPVCISRLDLSPNVPATIFQHPQITAPCILYSCNQWESQDGGATLGPEVSNPALTGTYQLSAYHTNIFALNTAAGLHSL